MLARLIRRSTFLVALVALATSVAVPAQPAAAADADSAYVMGYFKESLSGAGNVNALHLAVSDDGREWTPLNDNNAILTPTAGTKGIRDPFLYRLRDGSWVALATDIAVGGSFAKANPNIHVWTSPDLVNWSADRLLKVNGTNPNSFSWAPAVHWDPVRSAYGITFTTIPQGSSYSVIAAAYTTDFVTATDPMVFYDTGSGILDSHVVTDVNGQNYLYYKSNATGRLAGARSTSVEPGSFTKYTEGVAENRCTEAPTLVKSLTSSTWSLWGDTYCPNAKFDLWQGDLVSGAWTKVGRQSYTAPLNAKHNTVQPITAADRDRLLARYGGTSWNLLKSYNFPGHYARHAAFAGRISEMPFDPYQDAQWRLRPGLSDANGVSFESVNFPGYYMKQENFAIKVVKNDGTAAFATDATFTRVAGLADGTWSSFRSARFPTRYLRHSSFALRLDEISTATGRADATFDIVH
ncbi:glycoside hydrolase family 43 protein [Streptomyces europaeiscabiei]|uniref:glycoside hydrolase family 43 protein n=1 Tax=Streptomyces europaeiscabiei TaxID=146819 RepID=UPI0029B7D72B|nr:glycoside hydrolase family 43 protein [Streptomyces europaeiscabiei]MDX3587214.1 glycoside hydrolase family 43 protein [Streptomyces europaeiscabiei]